MPSVPPPPARELGLKELAAIGIGGMIGGGIFSMLGLAVHVSGHAAPLAFAVGSVIALVAGYSYARLALAFPDDGASYAYLKAAFPRHRSVAGVTAWTVVLGYVGTLGLYSFTFAAYGAHLLGAAGSPTLRAALTVLVMTGFVVLNVVGVRELGRAQDLIVYAKVALLFLLGAVGFLQVDPDAYRPLLDRGPDSVLLGGALIFVAYEGFQLITNGVQEARRPERDVWRGILTAILVVSAIYVSLAFVAVGTLDEETLLGAREYALAAVARPVLGRFGPVLVDVAALLATASAINATLFGASRVAREAAADRLAPHFLAEVDAQGLPTRAVLLIGGFGLLLGLLGGLEVIASFSSLTFLLVSIAVCVANLRLRHETRSRIVPIGLGLVLMLATVALLLAYMVEDDPNGLRVVAGIYGGVALAFVAFNLPLARLRRR